MKDNGIKPPSLIIVGDVVKLRDELGGHLILAHPAKHTYVNKEYLVKLKEAGLDGIEVLSPHHTVGAVI